MIDAGLNAPHSCRQGNCGACMLRILDGEVELVHNEVLEDEDFAENWTLACQAIPRSEHVSFTYDAPAEP
jgi:3-ketosteroid 9alpha-monooxygenase subunit B